MEAGRLGVGPIEPPPVIRMMDQETLSLLVCPTDRARLVEADALFMARVNRAIASGRLVNRVGRRLDRPLDGALVRADDHALFYPILDGIPLLLADEAISLESLEKVVSP